MAADLIDVRTLAIFQRADVLSKLPLDDPSIGNIIGNDTHTSEK